MKILHTRNRQRGVSAWTMIGMLLVVAGMIGLGIALIKPEGYAPAIAPVAAGSGGATSLPGATRPAAPGATPTAVTKTLPIAPQPEAAQALAASDLNPIWFGVWQGEKAGSRLEISGNELVASWTIKQDNGTSAQHEERSKWSPLSEDKAPDNGYLLFGYAKRSKSPAEIRDAYEKSVTQFKLDPSDFTISDPVPSRRALAAIKPGNYRVVWTYLGGDCGYHEFIVDGDAMLQVSQCKYGHSVEFYTRLQ